MKHTLYVGLTLLCLVSMSTAAVAKGKPQQQQPSQSTGQPIEQGNMQPYNQPQQGGQQMGQGNMQQCQMQRSTMQQPGSQASNTANGMPSRSNKGGLVRGRDRAQQVQQMNKLAKNQRNGGTPLMQQGGCLQPRN